MRTFQINSTNLDFLQQYWLEDIEMIEANYPNRLDYAYMLDGLGICVELSKNAGVKIQEGSICGMEGFCKGASSSMMNIQTPKNASKDPCSEICSSMPESDCTWYSKKLLEDDDTDEYKYRCIFYKNCETIEGFDSGFESSQRECSSVALSYRSAMCHLSENTDSCVSPNLAPRSIKLAIKSLDKKSKKVKHM